MKKIIVSTIATVSLFAVGIASAQTYYPYTPTYTSSVYGSGCVNITQTLSVGSTDQNTGGQVSVLQRFLVSQNLLSASLPMGYFGSSTGLSVRTFQRNHGLPVSGVVGEQTRSAIQSVSCSGQNSSNYNYNYGNNYTYPGYTYPTYNNNYTYPNYNSNYNNNYYCNGSYVPSGTGCGGVQNQSCAYWGSCNSGNPTTTYINPAFGAVSTSVTVMGSGFSSTGNTIHFGNGIITNLNSIDGTSLSFTVPSQLSGYGSQPVTLGTYNVSVTNASGVTSNSMPFAITSLGTSGTPTIQSVNGPTSIAAGTQGVWTIVINSQFGNPYVTTSVRWGDENLYGYYQGFAAPQTTYATGQQTLTFTHTYQQSGTYSIIFTVSDSTGLSNTSTLSVTVTGATSGSLNLSSLSPTSGHIGQQIILTGSGFANYGNVVHFGTGGQLNVSAVNGTTIYFNIPAWVSPCDLIGYGCAASAMQVVPNIYPIYVTNNNGSTGVLNFTVTP